MLRSRNGCAPQPAATTSNIATKKPLERTQDWIKLGGKARPDEEKALILEQAL
ncbi:hypothetical protein HFO98_29565 [Rhizobium leguminosarum]|uniref:hypothetical protein n=1 Tax=Rhizobium leguminosarum TaxID=384 RepID=UPI001C95C4FD|nr:hypothetical protein [Rhizobium leguminosarum]MBY5412513.1 hypothetical protein [Rhizobium leguminosarum]